ncbi:hypothetical protein RSAG8_01525, partial [Rhizoctonia solani AG-8 WAC10335]
MVSLLRTLRSIRRVGLKEYVRQMWYIGDAKSGRFVGADKFGNRYFENTNAEEEVPPACIVQQVDLYTHCMHVDTALNLVPFLSSQRLFGLLRPCGSRNLGGILTGLIYIICFLLRFK